MNWARLIVALGGQIIPIFLHDAKQQQIVGVIAAEAQNVFNVIDQLNAQKIEQAASTVTPTAPSSAPVGPRING